MISIEQAQELMEKYVYLRDKYKFSGDMEDLLKLKRLESLCAAKFKYLITMKTERYKPFHNYEDLNQDGYEALLRSMQTYNPVRGNFFYWAHRYIDTHISRSANNHTTIRYPIGFAKKNPPHKETKIPTMIEERFCPENDLEVKELQKAIQNVLKQLDDDQKIVVKMLFGIDSAIGSMSMSKICSALKMPRMKALAAAESALSIIKDNIKL